MYTFFVAIFLFCSRISDKKIIASCNKIVAFRNKRSDRDEKRSF